MTLINFAIGRETATAFRVPSSSPEGPATPVYTVLDLLQRIDPPGSPKKHRGLWTVGRHVANCAGMSIELMPVAMLRQIEPEFSIWLSRRRYVPKSVTTFTYFLRKLIQQGDELLGTDGLAEVRQQWKPIAAVVEAHKTAPRTLVPFAISQGVAPSTFTEAHLNAWAAWMERRGRQHRTVRMLKSFFRQAVKRADLQHLLPMFSCRIAASEYAVPVSELPEPLQSEVKELVAWKQTRFAKGRPQRTRLRPISGKLFANTIARLYGFATNIASFSGITSISALFTEEVLNEFADWAVNTRHYKRSSVLRLAMIHSALRHHPKYKDEDYTWFLELCNALPKDDESEKNERKAQKYVSFDRLREIAGKIRLEIGKVDGIEAARLAHDALLMEWAVTLPWRQRNLRECRLGSPETANVFLAPLPPLIHIAIPKSMEDLLKREPKRPVWQFHFRPSETKTGRHARGILPRNLVRSLEHYLRVYRPKLLGEVDPGTLFVNQDGAAIKGPTMTDLIAELTLKYTGVRSTPHLFRDSFSYAFLSAFPRDYLTLSKNLWHTSLSHTLKVYGSCYDESDGACRIDEWLGQGSERPTDVIQ